jgi:hypothetical protein
MATPEVAEGATPAAFILVTYYIVTPKAEAEGQKLLLKM